MPTPGKNYAGQVGFPTPDSIPEETGCRAFYLPNSADWYGLLMGALQRLRSPDEYYQWGTLTAEETAALWDEYIWQAYEGGCAVPDTVPTPFWDEVTETDDTAPAEEQVWYGEVDDPLLPADELTFIENAGIWAFTGFLALSGTPAAAIAFHTAAPAFVLAMRGDDFAQVIRVIVDAEDYAAVEMPADADALVETPVFAGESETGHDILLVFREVLT